MASGIKAAKDLGNMPPNICNAGYPASQARQLADAFSTHITTRVIGEQQMKELGMNAYLAVGAVRKTSPDVGDGIGKGKSGR